MLSIPGSNEASSPIMHSSLGVDGIIAPGWASNSKYPCLGSRLMNLPGQHKGQCRDLTKTCAAQQDTSQAPNRHSHGFSSATLAFACSSGRMKLCRRCVELTAQDCSQYIRGRYASRMPLSAMRAMVDPQQKAAHLPSGKVGILLF